MKFLKGHRTLVIARFVMMLAIFQEFAGQIFPPEYSSYVLFSVAVVMEIMRWLTDTPVKKGL